MKDHHHSQLQIQIPLYISIIHIAIRISLANTAPITDCDEVYNYWEPLHYLNYKFGLQTWEYAPQYALRTYAYLLPLSYLSNVYNWVITIFPLSFIELMIGGNHLSHMSIASSNDMNMSNNKVIIFHLLRASIAFITSIAELRLVNAISTKYSTSVALFTWVMLVSSTGMFHTAPAYLPSSTVMICVFHSLTEQISYSCSVNRDVDADDTDADDTDANDTDADDTSSATGTMGKKLDSAIIYGLIAVLMTGWPFCAVLFIPLALYATFQNYHQNRTLKKMNGSGILNVMHLYKRVALHAIVIQIIVMVIDYKFYGSKWISPTINIFIYNTGLFSGGGGDEEGITINRDELYGVEDVSYYIKNLILNWNIAALISVVGLPLLFLYQFLFQRKIEKSNENMSKERTITMIILLPMVLWIGIVFSRPHKEERFLFPIYPMIAVGTALVIDKVLSVLLLSTVFVGNYSTQKQQQSRTKIISGLILLTPFVLFSISRSMALVDGYTAPLKVYSYLYNYLSHESAGYRKNSNENSTVEDPMLVCTGGEWYRFPSSYHLPSNFRLAFLKSSFGGQLPQQFTQYGSMEESLGVQKGKFNDLNEEEMDRYVKIEDCTFVIELLDDKSLVDQDSSECLKYMKEDKSEWVEVINFKFLDAENTSLLHRVLFVPFKRKVGYKNYTLFEKKKN